MDRHLRFTTFKGKRLHLGICGSIASYKALDLLRRWQDAGIAVGATMTAAATRFLTPLSFEALGASPVHCSMFAPSPEAGLERDNFAHLTPGSSAQAFAIVAATANTLARLAHGLADELLSCQALAFPGPLVLAPAMNPRMWNNPATQHNCAILQQRGYIIITPASGRVACLEEGQGRLADSREIYLAALKALSRQDLAGQKVMVTLGPTREFWDGARYWSNPSTGTMGAALAVAAFLRGAEVQAICGPGTFAGEPWLPSAIQRHAVISADEMFAKAAELWPLMDLGIFTAAVADFSPEPFGSSKFKKIESLDGFSLKFNPNRDILKSLAAMPTAKSGRKIIGFAAETQDLETAVRSKCKTKGADMLVGNYVNQAGSGFASADNTVFIADAGGRGEWLPAMGKADLAWRILDWLSRL